MRDRRAPGDPPAVISDIDGTLVSFDGAPRADVVDWVNAAEGRLVVVTGRTEDERDATVAELDAAGVRDRLLYMKPDDDVDTVAFKYAVAEDLLREYDVWVAVDDDAACRAEYQSLGIDAVAPGDLPDDEDDEDDQDEARQVDTTPPQYVRDAAARGLELRADGFGGDGLAPSTIREARAMARGDVTEDKVKRAAAWAARHAVDLEAAKNSDPDDPEWPGPGAVAHYLWGIDPLNPGAARAWFDRKAEQIKEERGAPMDAPARNIPTDNLVRAATSEGATTVSDDGRTLYGHFSMFNNFYEINSAYEGRFLERIAPGAFADTLQRNGDRIKVLYDHGMDPQLGNKPLGTIRSMGEDKQGAYYEVALIDTDYNRNFIIPATQAGLLGSSFRFRVVDEKWDDPRRATAANPERLPERTITKLEVFEFGPVTFPANPAATAAVRSATDDWHDRLLHDPKFVARFTERVGLTNVERVLESIPKRDAVVADATSASVPADVNGPHDVRSETPKAEQPADGRSKTRTKNQRLAAVAKALPVEGRKP